MQPESNKQNFQYYKITTTKTEIQKKNFKE
jgi:hypothetical protein